jgi:hypothetical protein
VDFLRSFQLVVDVVGAQLLPRTAAAGGATTQCAGPSVNSIQQPAGTEWAAIVEEFPGVVQPFTVGAVPSHGVEHHIVTAGPLATAKFRRLDPERLAAAKAEFQQMLKLEWSEGRAAVGPVCFTWSARRMAAGGPAATSAS